jgi:hypothetical protein
VCCGLSCGLLRARPRQNRNARTTINQKIKSTYLMLGICLLSWIPLRKSPQSSSEMVSSVIYGETYRVVAEIEDWFEIVTDFDTYKGYIAKEQFSEFDSKKHMFQHIVSDAYITTNIKGLPPIIAGGALLDVMQLSDDLKKNTTRVDFSEKKVISGNKIVETAKKFLGINYLWGGRTYAGIDCSGLTQIVYKINGIKIPRDSQPQSNFCEKISFENLDLGNLIFFGKNKEKISHVGIFLGNNQVIHASGEVRIDEVDKNGIKKQDGNYSHQYIQSGKVATS